MLNSFRNFTKSFWAKILLVIIIIPFVFWGMGGVFSGGSQNTLAKINNYNISTKNFMEHINSLNINPEIIRENINNSIIEQLLSDLINKTTISMQSKDLEIVLSDNILSEGGLINEGEISTRLGLKGIPFLAEKIIVERDLSFLEEHFCKYHVSQISSEKTVSVIKKAKEEGKIFTAGVSINNLSLNENDIGDFRTFLKLSPPLRTERDRQSLVQGVNDGIIDVIVSDHKPEDEESKRLTFSKAATGASGIETLLSLALELFHNKSIKLSKLIASITSNPAKILSIDKGSLQKGKDADLCIVDINKPWVVDKNKLKSKSKNTPIENRKLQGQVLKTFVKGEVAFERI